MNLVKQRLVAFSIGALWATLSGAPAFADDIEMFVGIQNQAQARPNILLVIDDSRSMDGILVTQNNYRPTDTYTGGACDKNRVYWGTSGKPPTCDTTAYFDRSGLKCHRALDAFAALGGGTYRDKLASYDSGPQKRWEQLSTGDHGRPIECAEDWGNFGDEPPVTNVSYPRNGDSTKLWTAGDANRIAWGANPTNTTYWLYDGNWLNWYYSAGTEASRMQVVKDVANNLVSSINGVNIGLMHFTQDGAHTNGGNVSHAVANVSSVDPVTHLPARDTLRAAINALEPTKTTPLSETMFEATRYYMGGPVKYGKDQTPESVAASRRPAPDQNLYKSPVEFSCQKNYLVYLTDGVPNSDDDANDDILQLADANGKSFTELVGSQCDIESYPASEHPSGGQCLDDLAQFLHDGDLSSKPGKQSVVTHVVGFALGGDHLPVLEETAHRGGGNYYEADDTASLTAALSDIITNALDTQATFTSPTVSINSFNRTRTLNDLYVNLFEPSTTRHWPGNLKKFRLRPSDGVIVDAAGTPAINPATGVLFPTARSFWAQQGEDNDGADVELGGAAHRIPVARKVYTYSGTSSDLTDPSNAISTSNGFVSDTVLGTEPAGSPTRSDVIAFINGQDAADNDNDGDKTEPRYQMGDALHSQAVAQIYGPTVDDAMVFVATNDGYLHALDAKTGVEQWAFVPPEFLRDQVKLFLDGITDQKDYGIDGSLRIQAIGDNDGTVEAPDGEKVYLFFGMRRGGSGLYALDVTLPDHPKLLWKYARSATDDGTDNSLTGIQQSWSSIVPTRMRVQSATQNANKLVVVVGGGYDPNQGDGDQQATSFDVTHPNAAAPPGTTGNSIYVIDSASGDVLWHGSKDGRDKDFNTANKSMDYSIPADVKVVDLDGDGFADRMYAADMGGQIWRFDVFNDQPASSLITGGVIAQLGAAPTANATLASIRRFYASPDVAIATDQQTHAKFVHVGIGSGHREHPLSLDNEDRFYALRDKNAPLGRLSQSQFDALTPITDADLVAVTGASTTMSQDAKGWKLELNSTAGEKVLSEARTFNNAVFFTTYTPAGSAALTDPCVPALGTNRLYVMSVFNGAPVTNLDGSTDNALTFSDISKVTGSGSISPGVTFLFPGDDAGGTDGGTGRQAPVACVDFFCMPTGFGDKPIRTTWSQVDLD